MQSLHLDQQHPPLHQQPILQLPPPPSLATLESYKKTRWTSAPAVPSSQPISSILPSQLPLPHASMQNPYQQQQQQSFGFNPDLSPTAGNSANGAGGAPGGSPYAASQTLSNGPSAGGAFAFSPAAGAPVAGLGIAGGPVPAPAQQQQIQIQQQINAMQQQQQQLMLMSGVQYGQQQMGGHQRLGPMNPAQMTGNYGPAAAAAAAAAAAQNNQTGRTVYVGNLPSDASVDELLNLVRFGPIESVRLLPEKSCVFISFLDGSTAAAFHADASVKKLALHGQELKIGWGKASSVPQAVVQAITQHSATRNVYLGGLDDLTTEQTLRDDLSRFGPIDQVKIVRDKNIGFVHFLTISVATKVVNALPTEPAWSGKRVNYGKDRCAYVPKAQQAAVQAAQAQAQAAVGVPVPNSPFLQFQQGASGSGGFGGFSPFGGMTGPMDIGMGVAGGMMQTQAGNRTIYIGNLHPETTTEELCNCIRGGMIAQIRYMPDKHIAFVTFVDAGSAASFHNLATYQGLMLNSRRLKVGWGKPSGPLHPATAAAVQSGASRNIYVGGITDFEAFSEERLRRDFSEYGDIELVNSLKEKSCSFINFTSLPNAMKALEAIRLKPDYTSLKVAYGKDRCANPPRSNNSSQNGHSNNRTRAGTENGDHASNSPPVAPENGAATTEESTASAPAPSAPAEASAEQQQQQQQ